MFARTSFNAFRDSLIKLLKPHSDFKTISDAISSLNEAMNTAAIQAKAQSYTAYLMQQCGQQGIPLNPADEMLYIQTYES